MQFLKNLLKNRIALGAIAVVVIAGSWYGYKKVKAGASTVRYVTAAVSRGTLTSSVSGTGQVEASNQIDIKPQTDGRLTSVRVKENQKVKTGDVIAVIDQQSAANSVAQAQASLDQAQANYQKLMDGATNNEVASSQLSVNSAQLSLDNAKKNYDLIVDQQKLAVSKAHSAYLSSGLEAIPSDVLTTASITVSGSYTGTAEGTYTISLYSTGNGTYYSSSGLGSASGQIIRGTSQPIGSGLYINFSTTGILNNSTTWQIDVPNQRSANYVSNQNAYLAAQQSQTSALQQAQNSIASAQNSLDSAKLQFDAKIEPPTNADIASVKAQVTSAKAQLANAQTAYQNTILKAPFDGVVASLDFSVGDKVTAGSAVATIITQQRVAKISLNEVDAAKIKVGQKATLNFPALPNLSLTGKVADIDNIGTVSQNVVNFSAKILLDTQDASVKPGMSVSASIITDVKQDVLSVPSAAVKSNNNGSYVQVLVNGQPVQIQVESGINGNTETEISGEIKEGDEVVTQTINTSTAAKTTTQNSVIPGLGGGGNAVFRAGGGGGNFGGGR